MISYTVKEVLSNIRRYCGAKSFLLKSLSESEGIAYHFHVSKEELKVSQISDELDFSYYVNDIEMLKLPTELKIVSLEEENDLGEKNLLELQFEAQLFIKIFRLMRDRVQFSLKSSSGVVDCIYLDRKMYFTEEMDNLYKLTETNLYKFYKKYGSYSITNFSPLVGRMDRNSLISSKKTVAEDLDMEFQLVRD